MKQQQAVESFLAGRRVVLAKFVAHHYKEVSNSEEGRRHREPLRSSMCRREDTHRSSVVSAQRPDGRAGRQGMSVPVQGRTEIGGGVRFDGAEHV